MTIAHEIDRPTHKVFRRAFIRRRLNTTGLYETDWQDITSYVKSWGSIQRGIDDTRLNRITHSGINLTLRNDTGAFNPETSENSLWYGYMTRYRTMIKIEGGYYDDSGAELPTDTTLGIYIITDEIPISAEKNEAVIMAKSIVSIFDEVRAEEVAGLGPTQTASDLITKIKVHTDGAAHFYFQQFISAGAWTIQATTNLYNFATSTAIGSMSCWEFIEKLAEAEGYVPFINRTGGFEFRNRDERTTTAAYEFRGLGYVNPNIIAFTESKEAYNKLYTFFRLKYLSADTSTSFVTSGSTSSVDPSSTAWKYGARIYDFENTYLANTATAQAVVTALNVEFGELKNEIQISTNFVPHLDISDKISMNYRSFSLERTVLWDDFTFDVTLFPLETGENFDLANAGYKILAIDTDLDNFKTFFKLREI